MFKNIFPFILLGILFSVEVYGQCVGTQGQVTWQYWRELPYYNLDQLYVDDTYPMGPDGSRTLNSLSTPYNYDDMFGSVTKGFISVTQNGLYEFNLTGDDETVFFLSSDATRANLDTAAYVSGWTGQEEYYKYDSQTSISKSLLTNRLYYFEIHHREGGGGDFAAVHWNRPGDPDSTWYLITSPFLTDVCDPICPLKGTPCNDGLTATTDDVQDGSCNCVGRGDVNDDHVGERGVLQAYFYHDITDHNINTLMMDADFPSMPDNLILHRQGLFAQWDDSIDNFGMLIKGYITVPVSGNYDFNITGTNQVRFYLSSDHDPANLSADFIGTRWGTSPLEHNHETFGAEQTRRDVNLQANRYYYFEVVQVVSNWGHRFSVFWNGPHHDDADWHKIPEIYTYDYTNQLACLGEGMPCDDGDPLTANDIIDPNCNCAGTVCQPFVDCDDPAAEFIKYDYCETTYSLDTRADDAWISCTPTANPFVAQRSGYHWIHYDLGDEYELGAMHIWNYNVSGQTNNGFQNVAVDYSLNGVDWFHLSNYTWSLASGQSTYTGFSGPNFNGMPVRFVMITSLDNPSTCRGLSKVTFAVDYCENQGTPCNDANALTMNDHYDDQCQCVGYTAEQLNCAKDTLFLYEDAMTPQDFHAISALMSKGKIMNSSEVHYRAGMEIVLESGFEINMGSLFDAQIADCPPPTMALLTKTETSKKLKIKERPEESIQVYNREGHTVQTVRFYIPQATHIAL